MTLRLLWYFIKPKNERRTEQSTGRISSVQLHRVGLYLAGDAQSSRSKYYYIIIPHTTPGVEYVVSIKYTVSQKDTGLIG